MDKLRRLLQTGRNGNALLFCGADLTGDCLNFNDDSTVGVSFHLLGLLNDKLKGSGKQSGYKDIKNAAKRFRRDLGNYSLMQLLKARFQLNKVSASIVDIVQYPWATIYTTNYDNGLELALQNAGKKFVSFNNLDAPSLEISGTPIIHLHGFAEHWDSGNFEQSCILDVDSYRHLFGINEWLNQLRFDIESAEIVVFVGFNAADFHLEQVFFNASGLKEKAFFINYPAAEPDPDIEAVQEDFGIPLYIGRENFAQIVTEVIQQHAPREPSLASFSRFQPPQPSTSVPSVEDIEGLFIWGNVVPAHMKRDSDLSKSDYHVLRQEVHRIQDFLGKNGEIVLLYGDICDGKNLIILGAINELVVGRPVFQLRHSYANLLDEVSSILSIYPNAIFVVRNCFSIHEDRLLGLARQVAASEGNLIFSARSVSTEAETGKLKSLRAISSFQEMGVGQLAPAEIDALITLIDQIAGWREFKALSHSDRRRFIEEDCRGVIPSVLLRLLESKYVRDKYREEYQKINYLDVKDRRMIVATLLISNIGLDVHLSDISDIFEMDFAPILRKISNQSGDLKLVRAANGYARTIASIGTRNLLRHVIEDRVIVDTTINILEKMSLYVRRSDFQQHVFLQLMRYSILNSTVTNVAEVNRFFDHISKIHHFRKMPLFWLQWHMAMCAQEHWLNAERYLKMGYTTADAYEKRNEKDYNRKQLNDRKAKFLAFRATSMERSGGELFRDLKEGIEIVGRLIRDPELTHHPFETLLEIANVLQERKNTLFDEQQRLLTSQLKGVVSIAERKLDFVADGYQRNHAESAISQVAIT